MFGWEKMYSIITNDILMSGIIAVSLLVIGYVCSLTSKNCIYSYHIGKDRDAAAGRFAMLSLVLYMTAGITLGTIGYHTLVQNENRCNTICITNNTRIEVSNPLTEWFDKLYENFRGEIVFNTTPLK